MQPTTTIGYYGAGTLARGLLMPRSRGLKIVALLTCVASTSAFGQSISPNASLALIAFGSDGRSIWQQRKYEDFSWAQVLPQLEALSDALLLWANDHGGHFPPAASILFEDGYITDPLLYYRIGDVDPPPTTIDNDSMNAENSAQISFEYFGANGVPYDPDQVLFRDNSSAYNGGLGRYEVYTDGHLRFVPDSPHTFQEAHVRLRDESFGYFEQSGLYTYPSFPLPDGMIVECAATPASSTGMSHVVLTQGIKDFFANHGYGNNNILTAGSGGGLIARSIVLEGSSPEAVDVTLTVQLEGTLTLSSPSSAADRATLFASLLGPGYNIRRSTASVQFTNIGVLAQNSPVILEQRELTSADVDFVPGTRSLFIRAVAKLVLEMPPGIDDWLSISWSGSVSQSVSPERPLGTLQRVLHDISIPASTNNEHVIMYGPAGHQFTINRIYSYDGPDDVLLLARHGDINLDGAVDAVDFAEWETNYSGPIGSLNYQTPSLAALAAFDHDGDGDIDCGDWIEFQGWWTDASPAPSFVSCQLDTDGDGVPDGDDDCPGPHAGISIDERGCPRGDFNIDGVVDLVDAAFVSKCMVVHVSIPQFSVAFLPPPPLIPAQCANAFDVTGDGFVDLVDLAAFQNRFGAMP